MSRHFSKPGRSRHRLADSSDSRRPRFEVPHRREGSGPARPHPHDDNIVYGKNPVREILRAKSRRIQEVLLTREAERNLERDELGRLLKSARVPLNIVEPAQLNRLAPDAIHQNIVARVEPYRYAPFEALLENLNPREIFLLLDSVQDPQNFATLCRSALAFGVGAVILPKDRSVSVTGVVCKASSGAVEHLRIAQVTNLVRAMEELKEAGFWVYGTSLSGEPEPLHKIKPAEKSAIVLGSEGEGLRPLVAKTCDVLIKIPMRADFDSLNVAQAGTVCLYEFAVRE